MKINTLSREDHQVTMTVQLEAEQMVSAKHRAARRISERKSIPGFRPGKAPYDVVIRTFGEGLIVEEAVDLLLDEIYPRALKEANLETGASGSLEKVENLDTEPTFIFIVPLAPQVDLGDYRSVRSPYNWEEPDDEKVDESLEELRHMYAKTETVSRPIQKGDFVMIDLKGVDKKAVEGDSALIDRPGLPIFIRKDEKAEEYPFPGFSNELIGLSENETKSFSHKYKKKEKDNNLQGKTLEFTVTVKLIRGSILPDLNDDFAKQAGPFENLKALRDAVKANLATQSKAQYDDEYFNNILEKIKEGSVIKYPPQVVDHEVEHVMEDLKSRLASQNLDMAAYLKSKEMDEERFKTEEARPIAIKRLERSLLMDELAKVEKIEVSQEMLKSSFQETWGEYQGDSGFQKLIRGKSQPPKKIMDAVAMESANRAYVQQTLNKLKEIATGAASEIDNNANPGEVERITKPSAKKSNSTKNAGNKRTSSTAATSKKVKSNVETETP